MISVVLADDQSLVRAGLALLLELEPDIEVVASVNDGSAAIGAASELRPDVVVMDVRMPVLDGIEATRRIINPTRARSADENCAVRSTAVLVLTTYDVDEAVFGALQAGAAGFLLKDAAPMDLANAVRSVAAGGGWLSPAVTRRIIDQFVERPLGVARSDPRLATLTAREVDVLRALGRGLTNREIAAELFVGEGTVKTHVSHLLTKLELRDRAQAAVFAFTARLVET